MKRLLLATAALVTLSAPAMAADGLQVKLGGSVEFQGGATGGDRKIGLSGDHAAEREFRTETEISVDASSKADNGLEFGAVVTLGNGDDGDGQEFGIKESYLRLGGGFGSVLAGDTKGAAERLTVAAPTFGIGQVDANRDNGYSAFLGPQPFGGALYAPNSDRATKVTYFTPKFSGFQVGISYVPETDKGNSVLSKAWSDFNGGYEDMVEVGAAYSRDFGPVTVKIGGTVTTAKGTGADTTVTGFEKKNFTAWQTGAQVAYQGFTVGGGYTDAGSFNVVRGGDKGDQHAWNLGVSYGFGPFTVGASYLNAEGYTPTGAYASKYDAYGVGATYNVAPGMLIGTDFVYVDQESRTTPKPAVKTKDQSYIFMMSTKVQF